jgi:PAS domain S-box-containing protein
MALGESKAQPTVTDLLFEKADVGLCLVAPDGTAVRANGEWLRSTGYAEEQVVGESIVNLFPQTRDMALALHARARAGHRIEVPRHAQTVNGRETWWEGSIEPVAMEGGTGLLITAREVSPASEAVGEALRESEERLREYADLLEHAPVLIRDPDDRITAWNEGMERLYGWALRESEGKYVAIHDRAPFGIALTKLPEATFVTANDAFLKMFGFSREEVIGKTSQELGISDRDAQAVASRELERSGSLRDFEITRRTKAGARIDLSISIERVTIAGSDYVLTTIQDVTRRKQAEEALRASEERMRLAHQVARVGTFEWDIQSGVNTWSPELEAMYGLPPGGFAGTEAAWESLVHPEDRAHAVQRVQEAVETGAPIEVEWRVVWPDGSVHWLAGRAQVTKDGSGKPLRLTGINIDITERKAADHALRAKEAELALILDRTPFMLTRCSRDLRYRYVSGAYAKMTGRTPDQIAGRPIVEIMGEEGLETIRPHVETVLRGEPVEYEEDVHFEGIGPRRLQVIYVPDRDEHDQVVGWIANIVDLTERRHAEALRVANAQLREADRNRTEFLAMLSHELRNPLAPIRNSLYLLGRAAPGGEQARHAQTVIERQVGQMTRLVDDLLDVTRVTRGKIRLQREPLDLNDLVQRTVEDHRTLFSKGEIRLEVLSAPLEVRVNGDRVRLAQVVGNLLQNAAKFTPRGGTTTVSVEVESGRGEAVVTVRDTGSGIQPDMLPRLFHAFSQGESTLDRSKGGLGLGLALVKGLAEMHGGSVSAESAGPGRGAAFTIRLPLETSAARAAPRQRAEARAVGAPRRVLVVEDNEDAADTLREVLELSAHVVEVAYSGRGGIERARSFHPDVVLCDIGLPEMDGYEVARKMRADPDLCHVALVAVSGYAQPEDVAAAREAGFDAHLAKPPSLEALERALAEMGRGGAGVERRA